MEHPIHTKFDIKVCAITLNVITENDLNRQTGFGTSHKSHTSSTMETNSAYSYFIIIVAFITIQMTSSLFLIRITRIDKR